MVRTLSRSLSRSLARSLALSLSPALSLSVTSHGPNRCTGMRAHFIFFILLFFMAEQMYRNACAVRERRKEVLERRARNEISALPGGG